MKYYLIFLAFLFTACNPSIEQETPPNIIIILADDLGYGELGVYGQSKIKTPNIDALARNGMRFTQHYSGAPVCAPARCVLLTGKHAGHAYIRGNDEWRERGEVWDYIKAFDDPNLEGQRPMPTNSVTIASELKKAGYTSGIFGKWGLGAPTTESIPTKQGFDYFYGYNCQRQAHNLYPGHLWENEEKILLNNELIAPSVKLDSLANPMEESSYAKFTQTDYAPAKIHEKAISFIERNREKPFFMYYASPLPHLPLQVLSEEVEKYKGNFGEEAPYIGDKGYFPNRYPKATYAAMISYLDQQVGELVSKLKEESLYENTLILFTSDNGPTYLGGVDFEFFESSKPLTNGYGKTKGFVYEGGIRVPMIASWPGKIQAGTESNHMGAFYDFLPTLCEITDLPIPNNIDGISFKAALLGEEQTSHDYLYWEFPSYKGQQAVRMGNWKGIRKNIFEGNMEIELYDLSTDLQEQNNIATEHPEIVAQITSIMGEAHTPAELERFKIKQLGD